VRKDLAITCESFEALLAWLNPDREAAGIRYETIRGGLIRVFISRGCSDAEHLADETFDRVCGRLPDIVKNYEGDPARYFHGVARNVLSEYWRRKEVTANTFPVVVTELRYASPEQDCLSKCLQVLAPDKRELLLDYYLYEKKAKVAHHRSLAKERGITENALRGQVHRLRLAIYKCVLNCMKSPTAETNVALRGIVKERESDTLTERTKHHSGR
jgi:DNA-directed RNA polymerase specialized sigma24 family protein